MKHIVITGGSRGIGKGLALSFLKEQCMVTISGRDQNTLNSAVEWLKNTSGNHSCHGIVCEISNLKQLEHLWAMSAKIHPIDIWINNAGLNHPTHKLLKLKESDIESVIETNIKGTILGSKVALAGMMAQGSGSLYNMEGFGSDGRVMEGMSIYGSSKSAIRYFTRTLVKEHLESPVQIGSISPGMVVTDMILEPLKKNPEDNKQALRIFHILADTPDKVTPWIARQILRNNSHGKRIAWLTPCKITGRFIRNMFIKRKVKGLPGF